MQIVTAVDTVTESNSELRMGYLWMIASVAALGGLLFGYDWVVIGGARPFYEAYFHLTTASSIGWANSCALLGCFAGSLSAGRLSDRLGRKKALLISAFLFAISSLLTGWAQSFSMFILWRIVGGVAIGLASNVSPTYIAEISPASWRGRLVSLNQLALVTGIVAAQVVNWRIAERVTGAISAASWNAQFGWRWMFTAVAVPALLFLVLTPFVPESPRWLTQNDQEEKALRVLTSIGGSLYGISELASIRSSLGNVAETGAKGKIAALWSRPLRPLLLIGISLAVLQQWCGINIIFNYAAEIYRSAGYGISDVMFDIVITGAVNLVFTLVAMLLVDSLGRRRLMLFGCLGIAASHLLASLAYRAGWQGFWVLVLTLSAIAFYAVSLAPVTWVLITELFPNSVRASGVSISVAALWISSFALTYTFPFLSQAFGESRIFLLYGGVCMAGLVFVYFCVPETKGRSLEQIEVSELSLPKV
jgi:sugar porter (SP) family MFS transporter